MEANMTPRTSVQNQSSATQNTGASRIKSATQAPLTTAAPSSTQPSTGSQVPAAGPDVSATQLTFRRQINSAAQPPASTSATAAAKVSPASSVDAAQEESKDPKPLRVSEIISALTQSSQAGSPPISVKPAPTTSSTTQSPLMTARSLAASTSKLPTGPNDVKPTTSSTTQSPLMAARSLEASTSLLPTRPSDVKAHVSTSDRTLAVEGITLGESGTEDPKTSSEMSQLISAMKTSPSAELKTDSPQAPEKYHPTNVDNPRIISASQPPPNHPSVYSVGSTFSEDHSPSIASQRTVSQPAGNEYHDLPPPLPARNGSFTTSSARNSSPSLPPRSATLPAPRGRPAPPTPQESPPVSAIRNRPVPPTPTSSDVVTPSAREPTPFTQIMTASLAKLNKEPPLTNQNRARTLPARPAIPVPEDLQSQQDLDEGHYDRLVYEQVDQDIETRIHGIEQNQLDMRTSLQREQDQLIAEVKKLTASVEHLKNWTVHSQQMLVADTTASQESVESLKGRSQDVTRLLREHIVLISEDVSRASASIVRANQERESARGHRIMHIFDWNVKLAGGSSKTHGQTVCSHGYLVKELSYMVTGTAQFSREGNIYLKITGAESCSDSAKADSELSGNFTCTVCVTDASDTMPGWAVGRVIGNLFKDNEWVVGTITAADIIEKGFCQEGQVFKLKYALDTFK